MVKKRSNKASKGSAFEREICRELSLWWTKGARDDIFWRASQSGGRATERAKHGKFTANSFGDVAYLDSVGKSFLDKVCIEIKRGYSANSDTTGLIDLPSGQPLLLKFLEQAEHSRAIAGTPYWMLIQKRDRRVSIVHIPFNMFDAISNFLKESHEQTILRFKCAQITKFPFLFKNLEHFRIVSIPLTSFLETVSPEFFTVHVC
jgi:hypothetical protein